MGRLMKPQRPLLGLELEAHPLKDSGVGFRKEFISSGERL